MPIVRHTVYFTVLVVLSYGALFTGSVVGIVTLQVVWPLVDPSGFAAFERASGGYLPASGAAILTEYQFATHLLAMTLPVALLCLAAHLIIRRQGWYSPYLTAPRPVAFAWWFVLGGSFIVLCAGISVGLSGGTARVTAPPFDMSCVIGPFVVLVLAWSVQGLSEEVLFRGLLLPAAERRIGVTGAVFLNAVFFSLLHAGNPEASLLMLLNIGIFTIFTCLLVLRTGTVWGAVGIHAGWNFAQSYLVGLPVSGGAAPHPPLVTLETEGPGWLTGGTAGLEGSVLASGVFAGLSLIYLLKSPRRHATERGRGTSYSETSEK